MTIDDKKSLFGRRAEDLLLADLLSGWRVRYVPERTGWMPLRMSVVARRGQRSETARATVSPSVKM